MSEKGERILQRNKDEYDRRKDRLEMALDRTIKEAQGMLNACRTGGSNFQSYGTNLLDYAVESIHAYRDTVRMEKMIGEIEYILEEDER